jgi:hypothetical protein
VEMKEGLAHPPVVVGEQLWWRTTGIGGGGETLARVRRRARANLDAGERRGGRRRAGEPAAGTEGCGGSTGARGFAGAGHEGGGVGCETAAVAR